MTDFTNLLSSAWSLLTGISLGVSSNELHRLLVDAFKKADTANLDLQKTLYSSLLEAIDSLSKTLGDEGHPYFSFFSNPEDRREEQRRVKDAFKRIREYFPKTSALSSPVALILDNTAIREVKEFLGRLGLEHEFEVLPEPLRNTFESKLPFVMLDFFHQQIANDNRLCALLQIDLTAAGFQAVQNLLSEKFEEVKVVIEKIDKKLSQQTNAESASVLVKENTIIPELPLSELPAKTIKQEIAGQVDDQLVWLTELSKAENNVFIAVEAKEQDLLTSFLLEAIKKFSSPPSEVPAITLAIGSPTSNPEKWPEAGVYYQPAGTTQPELVAKVHYQTDETLFMWLIVLAFRRNQMMELDKYLNTCPKQVVPRLDTLKQQHWPSLQDDLTKLKERVESPSIVLPGLGYELCRVLLASQIETTTDLLRPARVAFAEENFKSLSNSLDQLVIVSKSQPPIIQAEILVMRATLSLAMNRLDEVQTNLQELKLEDLSEAMQLSLALLLVSKGDLTQACSLISQTSSEASKKPDFQIIRRLILLWADTIQIGTSGDKRRKLICELSDIRNTLLGQVGISKALSLFLTHIALRLGEIQMADELLIFAKQEYHRTVEFLHLSALIDIHRAIVHRQNYPDRNLDKAEKRAVKKCIKNLNTCIDLAKEGHFLRPLQSLYTNLGVALHLTASFSTEETRRTSFRKSAEAFQNAASETDNNLELKARAANAWLLAGEPNKSASIFAKLPSTEFSPDLLSNYATALLMLGRPLTALELIEKLLEHDAIGWQLLTNIAIVLLVTGQPSHAIHALESARFASGQERWRVDYLLCKAYLKLGQSRKAESCIRLALEQRSFDPRLYQEHLVCFRQGTVDVLRFLLGQLEIIFDAMKADKSVLNEFKSQVDHSMQIYEQALQRHGEKKAQPGILISSAFAKPLANTDLMNAKLKALEEILSPRQNWSANAIIEHVRELTFDKSERSYTETETPRENEVPLTNETIEWKKISSAAERILDTCSVPVNLGTESINVLTSIADQNTTSDNVGHMLNLAARNIESKSSAPLKCYDFVDRVDYKGFQQRTVHRVFNEMHGRAILADEVGLGKTIEAGLVLTEYRIRRLVKRCLVIVPSVDLKQQWKNELINKFRLTNGEGEGSVAIYGTPEWRGWGRHTVCITTYQAANRNSTTLRSLSWDMIIADEAHHLRNRSSASFKLITRLSSRYLLLLTATPLQENIEELYSLATLVRPSLFGALKFFRAEYGVGSDGKLINRSQLILLLSQIMVRNTIIGVAGELSTARREFKNPNISLSSPEMHFYQELISFVLAEAKRTQTLPLAYYLLAREASSSPSAALATLQRMESNGKGSHDSIPISGLKAIANTIEKRSKIEEVGRIIKEVAPRKVLIFVEFRTTARELGELLGADILHGGLSSVERTHILESFRENSEKRVLVATPALGEGLNFEFCSVIVNYDLPWNPMRIEQRVGRVQRIGQKEGVITIYSLASEDTIEQEIRDGLVHKIRIFERVIGQIGLVLEAEEGAKGLHLCIHEIIRNANDEEALRRDLANFFDKGVKPLIVDNDLYHSVVDPPLGILVPVNLKNSK